MRAIYSASFNKKKKKKRKMVSELEHLANKEQERPTFIIYQLPKSSTMKYIHTPAVASNARPSNLFTVF